MSLANGAVVPLANPDGSRPGSWREQLLPGARIGVRYGEDPNFVHERILGWPASDSAWLILTPHDHEYIEDFDDWTAVFPLTGLGGYGDHVLDSDEVIAFESPLEDAALVEFVTRARRLVRVAQRDEPAVYPARASEPKDYVDWDGGRTAMPAEGRVSSLRDRTGLFGVGRPKRRVSFKSAPRTGPPSLPPPRDPPPGAAADASDTAGRSEVAVPDIAARGPGGGAMPAAFPKILSGEVADVPSGQVWVVSEPGFGAPLGEPVMLNRDCVVVGDRGLWIPDASSLSAPIPIQRISQVSIGDYAKKRAEVFGVAESNGQVVDRDEEVEALKKERDELRTRLGEFPEPDGPAERRAFRDRVGLGGAGGGGGVHPPAGPRESADRPPAEDTPDYAPGDDERTLWVDVDEHNDQWKPWRNVVRESFTRGWGSEWDLDGPPSCLDVSKHFDKNGGDPRLWLQLFEADKGIKRTDRLHHELATLIDALYYAGSVDCLNLGGLLCLEVIARRLESIVEALRDGQEAANWDTAKYLAGRRSAMDCVSSGLRSWASSQVQNEVRVQSYRTRARGLTNRNGPPFDDGEDDGAPTAADGGRPTPPGKGKKPRGKGRGGGRGKL